MTKLLEKALEAVRRLSPDDQDEIALAMLTLAGNEGEPEEIDPAHLPRAEVGGRSRAGQAPANSQPMPRLTAAFRRFER